MDEFDLSRRVADLERRVLELEAELHPQTIEEIEFVPQAVTPIESALDATPILVPHRPPPLPPMIPAPGIRPTPVAPLNYQKPKSAAVAHGNFERAIGLKLAGWAGAVVLLIGIAFGVKFVYEQHWFHAIPPIVWLGLIFAAGFGLIAAGEWVFRRVHPISAVGLFGAGVATLFLGAFVGTSYYQLYSPATAMVLMVAAALIGGAVALRGNFVSIAVLALIGGNLAPLLVANPHSPLEPFLLYLLAMQCVAVVLASIGKGAKWWTLRGLSLATTGFWVLGSLDRPGDGAMVMVFAALYAAIFQIEPILTSLRRGAGAAAVPVSFAIVTTSAFTALLLNYTQHEPAHRRGTFVVLLAVIVGAIGWSLTIAGRRAKRFENARPLAVAHRWSAIGLFALAVPIGLRGAPVEAAWGVMAVVLAVVGSRVNSSIARYGAAIVWALAVGHVAIEAQDHLKTLFFLRGEAITQQLIVGLSLALVGQGVALSLATIECESGNVKNLVSIAASVVWCTAAVAGLPPTWSTLAIFLYAALLIGCGHWISRLWLAEQGVILLGGLTVKWLADAARERSADWWSPTQRWVVINSQFALGGALALSIAALPKILPNGERFPWLRRRAERSALWLTAAVVFTIAGTLEVDRVVCGHIDYGSIHWSLEHARQCAFSVWWMLAACAAMLLLRTFDREPSVQRHWPTGMCGLVRLIAAKYLLVDLLFFGNLNPISSSVPTVFNFNVGVAAIIVGGLLFELAATGARSKALSLLLVASIVWIVGSMEVMRSNWSAFWTVGSASLSVYWSVIAIGAVVCGFLIREAALRYFGLGLFALTLLKVGVVDVSALPTGYRVLSLMGLGLLLIGTSVVYGRFGGAMLGAKPQAAGGASDVGGDTGVDIGA